MRRAALLPALVMLPWRRLGPEDCSPGTRPTKAMSLRVHRLTQPAEMQRSESWPSWPPGDDEGWAVSHLNGAARAGTPFARPGSHITETVMSTNQPARKNADHTTE